MNAGVHAMERKGNILFKQSYLLVKFSSYLHLSWILRVTFPCVIISYITHKQRYFYIVYIIYMYHFFFVMTSSLCDYYN